MYRKLHIAFALLGLIMAPLVAGAATLQVNTSGQLTGALGVKVNGVFYDVEFKEGTCASVFSGCSSQSDLDFTSYWWGDVASKALLNQVFLDTAEGDFDSKPWLTYGCSYAAVCAVLTPVSIYSNGNIATAWNFSDETQDGTGTAHGTDFAYDTTNASSFVWADWSLAPEVPQVPLPASAWLLGAACAGLSGIRRRRRVG